MTKLSNIFATLLLVSKAIAQNGSGSPDSDAPASGGSNKDIEASCSTPECFEGKTLTYYIVYSAECTGRDRHPEEVCLGSDAWCSHGNRKTLYGSAEKCLALRPKPAAKAPWQPKGGADCGGAETEKCLGTNAACSNIENEVLVAEAVSFDLDPSGAGRRRLAARGRREASADRGQRRGARAAAFALPDSEGCSAPGADEEPCLGSVAWCEKHGEGGKNACLLARGLDLAAFEAAFRKGVVAPVKEGILTWAQNVTRNAAFREILLNSTAEAAQKTIATDLSGYMDTVKASLEKQALEGLRKGLEKYAGQKLF
ncbi:hypothetical protein CCM_08877 [Cordyceps militaris CM01]|uniref:Uncharacterized protein n=1 Tax=Cordyceps militaris (strain CM01) TaxID=983644 RepID=G3JSD2_CORMM|nr:uncharacterized protein CCM_08877 [Cordyceps militaris CM01]EGX88831.1 hypothetical protein CCM_08877 [Cordyceps militaris CM01]